MVQISLQQEYVLAIDGFRISNTLITSVMTSLVLIAITIVVRLAPGSGLWLFLETLADYLLRTMDFITGSREESKRMVSLVATIFLFVIVANWLALIPGFLGSFTITQAGRSFALLKSPTADLNTTFMLAIISLVAIEYSSIRSLGALGFAKRFFNFSSVPRFIAGLFELISEIIKLISLSFRLFGNVFGGEVVIVIISFLLPFIAPVVFYLAEFFVGFIQAAIFAVLTLAYTKVAQQGEFA